MTPITAIRGCARRVRARVTTGPGDEAGFTFPELAIVMAMLGIGFTAAFFFYNSAVARTTDTQARAGTLAEQRVLVENISREAREGVRIVIRDAGGVAASSGNILDIYGVETASGGTRIVTRYDCSSTPGTCTRSTYSWNPGDVGTTVPVTPTLGALLTAPVIAITGIDSSVTAFSGTAVPTGSALSTFNVQIQALPDGRERPIRLERQITARNVCIYQAASPAPQPIACDNT